MRFSHAASLILLTACYGTGSNSDTSRADEPVVSGPVVHDTVPRSDTVTIPDSGEVQLRTDKTSYRGGEEVALTLINPTKFSYAYNPCTRLIEREVNGKWVELEEARVCTMIAHILAPRSSRSEKTTLTSGLEPGRYRLILMLSAQGQAEESRGVRLSAPITITP